MLEIQFKTHGGLPGLIVRSGQTGPLCGYVGVLEGHPCYGVHHDEVVGLVWDARLTFSGHSQVDGPAEQPDVWWLGFDCEDRDASFVRAEVERLALQLRDENVQLFRSGTTPQLLKRFQDTKNLTRTLQSRSQWWQGQGWAFIAAGAGALAVGAFSRVLVMVGYGAGMAIVACGCLLVYPLCHRGPIVTRIRQMAEIADELKVRAI